MKSQTTNPVIAFETPAVNAVAGVSWLEGASADKDGTIYFTDVKNNCIYKYRQGGQATVFKKGANYANGMTIDADGGLIACEDGDPDSGNPPRITRTDLLTGDIKILADLFEGRRFKGPNDVCTDVSGNIYFTDGSRPDFLPAQIPENLPLRFRDEVESTGVYRINIDGSLHRILTSSAIKQPNGIAVSKDCSKLYLLENDTAPEGLRQLLVFDLTVTGDAVSSKVLHDFKPGRSGDGIKIDVNGDLLVAAGLNQLRGTSETLVVPAGIHIFSPEGIPKGLIPIPEDSVTNLVALPSNPDVLFVTAGKTLFQVDRKSEQKTIPAFTGIAIIKRQSGMIDGFESRRLPGDGIMIDTLVGGYGPPLLLLHGFPQSRLCWALVAKKLIDHYTFIILDLRGYGRSDKPGSGANHQHYSKRTMALDMVSVMKHLGHKRFAIAGHDRGGRVAHRLALDHPEAINALCVMDINPTSELLASVDAKEAKQRAPYFFHMLPELPEQMIGNNAEFYIRWTHKREASAGFQFPEESMNDYIINMGNYESRHAMLEEIRASWSVDYAMDKEDKGKLKIEAPTLVLWGDQGAIKDHENIKIWREWADNVNGGPLSSGHYIPEEAGEEVAKQLHSFLSQLSK